MNQLDYKKKYEKLKGIVNDLYPHLSDYCKEKLGGYSHKSAESEDEKIRKELIAHIKANECADYVLFKKFSPDDVISWLEKQGEQKLSEVKNETKNKYPNYSEGYGCSTSPLKQCDTCPDYKLYNHWKPSEEQMEALKITVNCCTGKVGMNLKSLYNDIKKL